jgi:hypothetical protein
VAALVDTVGDTESAVTLVNLNPVHPAEVIIQGGAYREHALKSASVDNVTVEMAGEYLQLRIAPGSGARLEVVLERYANRPTLDFPW